MTKLKYIDIIKECRQTGRTRTTTKNLLEKAYYEQLTKEPEKMSDMIYYKNGEETFRISPPTVGTKCPETKLEVKKMTKPDYKIEELFDFAEMKVYYNVLKLFPTGEYFFMKRCDDFITAKDCVRMARKYENPIYHYVED